MNFKKSWLVVPAVLTLTLTACSGGAGSADQSGAAASDSSAVSGSPIITNGTEPQNPLIPANSNETGGGRILEAITARLTAYDNDGASRMELAESIESDDRIVWTVKLKKGQKFSDGTEVKAKNFVDAWILAGTENMKSVYFFEPILGYDDAGEKHDLSQGLKVVDDYTFTITLKQPETDFVSRLGYTAYAPMADADLADTEKAGESPIASGPYMFASENAWEHNVKIDLIPNPEYQGDRQAKNAGLTFVFYSALDAAYADLQGGQLDLLDAIPDIDFNSIYIKKQVS